MLKKSGRVPGTWRWTVGVNSQCEPKLLLLTLDDLNFHLSLTLGGSRPTCPRRDGPRNCMPAGARGVDFSVGEVKGAQTSGATLRSCSFNKLLAGGLGPLRQLSKVAYSLGTTETGTVTHVSALPVPAWPDRLEAPSSPWCRQSHALQHNPGGVGGAQAVPRAGLRRNEVRVSLPLCSALAPRSKLLGTPRFLPPGISCFPCATGSSAPGLGHPSDRKRLFRPQKRRALGFPQLLLLSAGALHGVSTLHQPST